MPSAALQLPANSIAPLDVWIAIKTVLRRELGEREWEMWIQHARLWRVMSGNTLGVLMPRHGKAIFGLQRHMTRVRRLAARMRFGVLVSVEYDLEYHQLKREAIEAMNGSDLSDDELQEVKWEAIDRNKGPEGERLSEFLQEFPVSNRRKAEMLEEWTQQHAWLTQPFLEPPCSPLWEARA